MYSYAARLRNTLSVSAISIYSVLYTSIYKIYITRGGGEDRQGYLTDPHSVNQWRVHLPQAGINMTKRHPILNVLAQVSRYTTLLYINSRNYNTVLSVHLTCSELQWRHGARMRLLEVLSPHVHRHILAGHRFLLASGSVVTVQHVEQLVVCYIIVTVHLQYCIYSITELSKQH